ncbi:hypothetical protein [Pedobacter sp. Hv1]|uniref:hypothetical protein n=1 Tax=Pedobacter sp. Hv1 TaxID=1740090 RepID=UPI0006D8D2DB|nr:hypothetical protein [Pedobacter sp. Hv1]KQC01155.1 hypothetical protein AQF98_10860 [Pedobacter sp. Hv1]
MKKFILLAALGIAAASYQPAKAQVSVSINIGSQPQWGPRGYDYVDYYYLPEVQSYYHVPTRRFVYLDRNRWVHRKSLPNRYRNYDLYQGRKIVINRPRPYLEHHVYQTNYSRIDRRYEVRGRDKHYYSKRDKHDNRRGRDRDRH